MLLGRVAQGENPAETRLLDTKAVTVKQLCERYLEDCEQGLVLGKGGRAKKALTIATDRGRIIRHIIPLLGTRRAQDIQTSDVNKLLKDIASGKTRTDVKTKKRGRAIVRGGVGAAARAVGLFGGIFTYAVDNGIVEKNPVRGIRKAKDRVKTRHLSEAEYRLMGEILRERAVEGNRLVASRQIRLLALTGCRRGDISFLKWIEADTERSALVLEDSKEGASVRAVGLPVVNLLEELRPAKPGTFVFPGQSALKPANGLPKQWKAIFADTPLADITPHVLRHSFATLANDLGFTEATVSALLGHSRGSVTSRYIHLVDTALIMAADMIAGYIDALMHGAEFRRANYALDRKSRESAMQRFFATVANDPGEEADRLAA